MYKLTIQEKMQPNYTPFFEIHTVNLSEHSMQTYNLYRFESSDLNELNEYLTEIFNLNNLIKNNKLYIKENNNIITDFKNHTNLYSLGYLLSSKKIIPFSTEKIMHKDIPSKLKIKLISFSDEKGIEHNVKFELLSDIIEQF